MFTKSKMANELKTKKENDLCEFKRKLSKHGELIAALMSGAIILITWSLSNLIPHSLFVMLHIVAFLIGGYAQAKEGLIDTIKEKELNVELLMIIVAVGSAVIGYCIEVVIMIFIFFFV